MSKESAFQNINDNEVTYVGMETCKSCHWQVYETYIQTGMGQSWGLATKEKSAADFSTNKAWVYDSVFDFYYKPYWEDDSLKIAEYRIKQDDTIHKRIETVHYIVGSGQHTNSHIVETNGYLHQAPITFYTQKGQWDLAPGFEKGANSRFERKIEQECITCHNGYPVPVAGSLNKYNQIKLGIDCERCHGPGSMHVAEKLKGNIVDTSQTPDYTIVNPRRLSIEAQNNLCQRCHLQGVAVLNDDKTFFDFKPSQTLSHTMNVFMPTYEGDDSKMIMASHVERMKMSNCYNVSKNMSCITCHNPHVSVKFTPITQYNSACQSCHAPSTCKEDNAKRVAVQDNCVQCHMPKNGSIDIPHVAVTDHFIRRKPMNKSLANTARFITMKCYNNDKPDSRTRARAFLEFFERYEADQSFLDSAALLLKQAKSKKVDDDLIRLLFLQEKYQAVIDFISSFSETDIQQAWTLYRIGESYMQLENYDDAIRYFKRAVEKMPYALDFQNKLCTALIANQQLAEAEKTADFVLTENHKNALANFYKSYILMQKQQLSESSIYLKKAIMLNPDHVQSYINMAVILYQKGQKNLIKPYLLQALRIDPQHTQAQMMLKEISTGPH
jgi:Tetratricopeptide repeat.